MKVYTVEKCYQHEGCSVEGVFDSCSDAEDYNKEVKKKYPYSYTIISDFELGKRGQDDD